MERTCLDCQTMLTGHSKSIRCPKCAPIHRQLTKFGKRATILTFTCALCDATFQDYESNRKSAKHGVHFCSPKCRAAWVGVHNSIRRGGDGFRRTKKEKDANYYRRNATKIRNTVRARYAANKNIILENLSKRDKVRKLEIVEAYGGKCACCAESHFEFLTIDHINGDGAAHRREVGKDTHKIYADLKKRGFPQDNYRLLCFNCNLAMGCYGYCPHNPEIMRQTFDKRPKKPGRPRVIVSVPSRKDYTTLPLFAGTSSPDV